MGETLQQSLHNPATDAVYNLLEKGGRTLFSGLHTGLSAARAEILRLSGEKEEQKEGW